MPVIPQRISRSTVVISPWLEMIWLNRGDLKSGALNVNIYLFQKAEIFKNITIVFEAKQIFPPYNQI